MEYHDYCIHNYQFVLNAMKIGVSVGVANSIGWFAAILADLIEIAEDVFEFILDSFTRGNLDNDILG